VLNGQPVQQRESAIRSWWTNVFHREKKKPTMVRLQLGEEKPVPAWCELQLTLVKATFDGDEKEVTLDKEWDQKKVLEEPTLKWRPTKGKNTVTVVTD
jgi:hypothetical protein